MKIASKKIKLSVLFTFSIGLSVGYAQQASTASGGDPSGSGGSVAYSVGQIVYTTHAGTTGSVMQGVHQPYEISTTTGLNETGVNLNLSAYPNPTTNYVILQIDNCDNAFSYQLFDMSGKLLESRQVTLNVTTIAMDELAMATYFLKVTQNNHEIKTFKIIKN